LTASTTTPSAGANFTLTATVTPAAATGVVTFYDSTSSPAVSLGTGTLSGGTATLTASYSTAGTYSLTATYGGSCSYDSSTTASALSITVN
jgi:hypothetical protein